MRLILRLLAASTLAAAAVPTLAAPAKKKVAVAVAVAVKLHKEPGWGKPAGLVPHDDWNSVWEPIENNMFDNSRGRLNPNLEREYPPYKPEWEARYAAIYANTKAGINNDPTASCLPGGMPRIMANPRSQEIIVTPQQVTIIKETQTIVRRIWINREMPAEGPDSPDPTFNGYSVGHWEGDTLVVDTKFLRGDTNFDRTGAPHSDKMTLHERIRLKTPDIWEDVITVTDPVAFTKPWTVTRTYARKADWDTQEYACEDNNRNALADGKTGVLPAVKK